MLTAYHADLLTLGWPKWAADIECEMLGSFLWSEVDRLRAKLDRVAVRLRNPFRRCVMLKVKSGLKVGGIDWNHNRKFELIESARIARGGRDNTLPCKLPSGMEITGRVKFVRDDYAVAKVFDDDRKPVPVKYNLTHEAADREAGRMRDALSDAEVQVCIDERWTYGVIVMKGGKGGNKPRGFIPRKRAA